MSRAFVVVAVALLCNVPRPVSAQVVLTLEKVISRAREQSGAVVVARARVAEADAAVLGASARFRDNPLIEGAIGPRHGDGIDTDLELNVSQQFETGGQRRARLDVARAAADRQRALVQEASRTTVFAAASAFLRGVAAAERLRIGEQADTISRDVLAATDRRYAAGDIAALDVNLARIDAARAGATLRGARADLIEAAGELRALLRLAAGEPLELRGTLDGLPPPARDALERTVATLPAFAAIEAEAREADAEQRRGLALRRPDLAVGINYSREATDTIVLGRLTVTLPVVQRGQGVFAAAAARGSRARLELETMRERASAELRTALDVYEQRRDSAEALASSALDSVADNESLARRSYDAGELNLMGFLLIRRDAIDTRLLVVERRLDAALSRLLVDYVSGVLR